MARISSGVVSQQLTNRQVRYHLLVCRRLYCGHGTCNARVCMLEATGDFVEHLQTTPELQFALHRLSTLDWLAPVRLPYRDAVCGRSVVTVQVLD